MRPELLKICVSRGPDMNDPFDQISTVSFKLLCSDGKYYGRGIRLMGESVDPSELIALVDSINKTWEMVEEKKINAA